MIRRIIAMMLCVLMVMPSMVYAETEAVKAIEAPKNLAVEQKTGEEGYPYFRFKMQVPADVEALSKTLSENEADLFYEVECKIGNGSWESAGGIQFGAGPDFEMNPEDMGLDADIDIKANVYQFRVKYGYYTFKVADENGNRVAAGTVFSPYSNIVTIGIAAYQKTYKEASTWAVPELDKAAEYGFITEKIKDNMNQPITREELCEVIIKLYEKFISKAEFTSTSTFVDTKNPEVYKAYELGIANGVGNNKFAPKDLTNREQVAAMMNRAVKAFKPDADFSIAGAENFSDEKLISSWALQSLKFMSKNGFIKGSNGLVNPKGTTTREQAVLIVLRTYEKYKN